MLGDHGWWRDDEVSQCKTVGLQTDVLQRVCCGELQTCRCHVTGHMTKRWLTNVVRQTRDSERTARKTRSRTRAAFSEAQGTK